eukprot:379827-Pyramimonas_sp.AAC.1
MGYACGLGRQSTCAKAKAKPSGPASASSTATLNDRRGPTWIANKAGFSVGCFAAQKDVAARRLCAVFSSGTTLQFREVCSRGADPRK